MRVCLEVRKGLTYFSCVTISHAVNSQMMSMEEPEEPVTRSELTALINAVVVRALLSHPREIEGNSGHFSLSTGIQALVRGRGYRAI